MTHHYATPGVYIEEQTGPGVIAGVGTSTAGFIGPALNGPINEARYITSWDEFLMMYGRPAPDGRPEVYIVAPRHFYLAHAVRGFFENGGHFAYIVRVGTARFAFRNLANQEGTGNAMRVEALEEGLVGNNITVNVTHTNLASGLEAARPTTDINNAGARLVSVDNAADFRPGDTITVDGNTERQTIERINYDTNEIFLTGDLLGTYDAGTLRIADLQVGQRTFRLESTDGLFAGSVVTIAQDGTSETSNIDSVREGFITLESGLEHSFDMSAIADSVTITSHEFDLTFNAFGSLSESLENLSMNRRHPNFYEPLVNAGSTLVRVMPGDPSPTVTAPGNSPDELTSAANLTGGQDDDLTAIGATEYQDGINALDPVDDVNFICMPDAQDPGLQTDLITHCVNKGDRFAILDAPPRLDHTAVETHRGQVESERGFAALYYPWLEIRDPTTRNGARLAVPPSGQVAGVYARVDEQRGVHKAPANELIRGALGLERLITNEQQANLNREGVNVIRIFPGQGWPVIWGARTTVRTDVTDWIYVNVRRLMLYLEESIEEGIRWAVFEPNNLQLWAKLRRTTVEFLTRVWRGGALFGATPEEAFYVRIDEALNPPATRALGRLYIEIGVAAVRPAEFIVVRIGLWDGSAEIGES